MNTLHSREFYLNNREKFVGKKDTIDPEKDLQYKLSVFNKADYNEAAWEVLTKVYAQQVVESVQAQLISAKATYTNVRNNPSCLGYASAFQQSQEAYRITTTFEFNCLELSQFKAKYNL